MSLMLDNLQSITKQLYTAANGRNICSLKFVDEDGYRRVNPHGIYMSKQKNLIISCWQTSGFSAKGNSEGFKNLPLEKCETVMVLNKKFAKRRDFNPKDEQYGEWLFHI